MAKNRTVVSALGKADFTYVARVFVPSTNNVIDKRGVKVTIPLTPIEHSALCEEIATEACKIFGGATILNGQGAWIDTTYGNTVYEAVKGVEIAFIPTSENLALLRSHGEYLKTTYGQDAVLIQVIPCNSWLI